MSHGQPSLEKGENDLGREGRVTKSQRQEGAGSMRNASMLAEHSA